MPARKAFSPEFISVVADPQRWRLLQELARSDRRVGELVELLDRPQNLVSYHVAQLRDAGLIAARRSAADGRDTYYRVDLTRCVAMLADAGASLHPGLRLELAPVTTTRRRGRAPSVLFLCTGNSARSQMAQALLEHRSGHTITARSAGSHPKALHPMAVRVLAERGIDITGRPTTHLNRYARHRFDHVITLCDKVREVCPEFPGHPATAHWSVPDPAAAEARDSHRTFVRTLEEIDERVRFLIARIATSPPRDERTRHDHR